MTDTLSEHGKEMVFLAGDTIYRQGEASTGVYMILDGQIDIWREEDDEAHHIASLGHGELLGEVSVIERRPHSVAARASKTTKVLFITAEAFRRSFSDPLVRHVVHTLAARLRSSYASAKASDRSEPAPYQFKSNQPTIEGSSRLVASKLLTFLELTEFPFMVGNVSSTSKTAVTTTKSLRIPAGGIADLSDDHFEIVKRDGALWVRDLGSSHGTIVNGEKLSRYTMTATARLKTGKNTVTAGGPESPVRFVVAVPDPEKWLFRED